MNQIINNPTNKRLSLLKMRSASPETVSWRGLAGINSRNGKDHGTSLPIITRGFMLNSRLEYAYRSGHIGRVRLSSAERCSRSYIFMDMKVIYRVILGLPCFVNAAVL